MSRFINGIFVLAAIIGFGMLMRQRSVLAELRQEHDRLSDRFGVLDVKDPNKFYVLRLDTGDSKEFLWRVYRPTVNSMQYRETGIGGSSSGSNSSGLGMKAEDSIYRYRFIFQDDHVDIHRLTGTGNSRSGISPPVLTEFLKKHWDELDIQVLEDGEYDVDEPLRFLKLCVPEFLLDELKEDLQEKKWYYDRIAKEPVYEIVVGTDAAFEKLDAEENP